VRFVCEGRGEGPGGASRSVEGKDGRMAAADAGCPSVPLAGARGSSAPSPWRAPRAAPRAALRVLAPWRSTARRRGGAALRRAAACAVLLLCLRLLPCSGIRGPTRSTRLRCLGCAALVCSASPGFSSTQQAESSLEKRQAQTKGRQTAQKRPVRGRREHAVPVSVSDAPCLWWSARGAKVPPLMVAPPPACHHAYPAAARLLKLVEEHTSEADTPPVSRSSFSSLRCVLLASPSARTRPPFWRAALRREEAQATPARHARCTRASRSGARRMLAEAWRLIVPASQHAALGGACFWCSHPIRHAAVRCGAAARKLHLCSMARNRSRLQRTLPSRNHTSAARNTHTRRRSAIRIVMAVEEGGENTETRRVTASQGTRTHGGARTQYFDARRPTRRAW
jgi:hypothetical protein